MKHIHKFKPTQQGYFAGKDKNNNWHYTSHVEYYCFVKNCKEIRDFIGVTLDELI